MVTTRAVLELKADKRQRYMMPVSGSWSIRSTIERWCWWSPMAMDVERVEKNVFEQCLEGPVKFG
jgi:hypothetical protein